MGQKLPADQLQLYKGIDDILWKDWDPIGISGLGGPRDEYHAYLPQSLSLHSKTQHLRKSRNIYTRLLQKEWGYPPA